MPTILDGWAQKPFQPTNPTYDRIGSKRRFGVELEYDEICDDYYSLEDKTVFGAKEDCSVGAGEFDSPILFGDQGLEAVDKFCGLAKDNDFEATLGAGYHLHLDMTNETIDGVKRIALAYHYTNSFWLGTVPRRRRSFTYSQPHHWQRNDVLRHQSLADFNSWARQDRYQWVNVSAYTSKKTFEIRCHESTIEAFPVTSWAIAHTRFCDAMSEMKVGRITRIFGAKKPTELRREIAAVIKHAEVSEHLQRRYNQYN